MTTFILTTKRCKKTDFRGFSQLIGATKTFCRKDADPSWLLCDYRTIEHIVEGGKLIFTKFPQYA